MKADDVILIVAKNIVRYRKAKKLSQASLAKDSGLHRAYIGQIERCEKSVGIRNLYKIAVALEIDIKKFFDGVDH